MSDAGPDDVLVVLAGGRSRRFGADKALAAFDPDRSGAEPLALRALRRLAPVAPRRLLVRGAPLPGLPPDVLRFADPSPGAGPLPALAAAFAAVPARRWFVAPCDLPWLAPAIYARLADALRRADAAAARTPEGLEPLVSAWTPAAAGRLAPWLDAEPGLAVHAALERLGAAEVGFDDALPFRNVNTREELERVRRAGGPAPAAVSAP